MEKWEETFKEAVRFSLKADKKLQETLSIILHNKGIEDDIALDFYVCFASGTETVVHYQNDEDCKEQLSDLDMRFMASMTKEEIYKYFGIQNKY